MANARLWINFAYAILVLLYFSYCFVWLVVQLQDMGQRRRFRSDLVAAILHSQPDWSDVLELARQAPVKTKVAEEEILKLKRKILIGKDTKLEQHKALLERYLKEYRDTEPFDGLPDNVRGPLERIKPTSDPSTFHMLTTEICEMISFQKSVNRRQRFYTASGFLSG